MKFKGSEKTVSIRVLACFVVLLGRLPARKHHSTGCRRRKYTLHQRTLSFQDDGRWLERHLWGGGVGFEEAD